MAIALIITGGILGLTGMVFFFVNKWVKVDYEYKKIEIQKEILELEIKKQDNQITLLEKESKKYDGIINSE
ncbi:MAG: hypothetical protein LBD29_03085 [Treponema sp.]|nr:hypothetical protein [Treponema sp.]